MSIVALKRKTAAKYNNLSVGQKNFSLNGTLRLQGYIGQNVISRHFPKTPMRNGAAQGYGGCCGAYYTGPSICIQNGTDFTNDPAEIKDSVLNNAGQLELRFRPETFITVKPDTNQNINTCQQYTTLQSAKTANKIKQFCKSTQDVPTESTQSCKNPLFTQFNNYQQRSKRCPTFTTKDPSKYTSVPQSTYIESLQQQTACQDAARLVQPRTSNTPAFGATVPQQPVDPRIAKYYDKVNRNFYLTSVKKLQTCNLPPQQKQGRINL
jgi:hypothetical protein